MSTHTSPENDQEEYIERVKTRCKNLIRNKIWNGVEEHRLDSWFDAMSNLGAKLLAAYILDNFSFRSKEQFYSLINFMVEGMKFPNKDKTLTFEEAFRHQSYTEKNGIILAPVISNDQPPTKSGPYILRLIQKLYKLPTKSMYWPHKLLENTDRIKELYFVDDFCGSGNQFSDFIKEINFEEIVKENKIEIYYLVAVIHEKGLKKIQEDYPNIKIIYGELLEERSSNILSEACLSRYSVDNFAELILQQYENVISNAGYTRGAQDKYKFGYENLGLAYSFAHGTPNNSLPVLWMDGTNITSLVDR
ncbi:hypothetical protein LIS44_00905 [Acinetobacter haemolyticus]|nr:hypothetical protein LIS44_00905 [Acinetobacter haemolyticus]